MHLHILHCFMKNLIIAGVVVCCIVAGISCSGALEDRCDANIREAEMALVQGDMRAAESVANHIMGSADTVGLTPRQLCRLSLIYMQLSDSADQGERVTLAADCYRRAYNANADSAAAFYANVAPEQIPYAVMLSTLVHSQDIPTDSLRLDE